MDRRKVIAAILMAIGIGCISVPIYWKYNGASETDKLLESFELTLEVQTDEEVEKKGKEACGKTTNSKKVEATQVSDEESDMEGAIGIIEIEALGIRYPIVEGAGNGELRYSIGHLSETAGIGEKGNCVLAGHNGSRYGEYFTHLNRLEIGDKVKVTDKRGTVHEYVVNEQFVVGPKENSIKTQTDKEELTLFTCAEHGTKRFVVKCNAL